MRNKTWAVLVLFCLVSAPARSKDAPVETIENGRNKKGVIDRWFFKRDGVIWKREYDRNGDDKADLRIIEDHGRLVQKEWDLGYNGTWDKIEKPLARGSSGHTKSISGKEVLS